MLTFNDLCAHLLPPNEHIKWQRVSRLVRKTLSFSKKLTHHIGAIKYFICHYNRTRMAALSV